MSVNVMEEHKRQYINTLEFVCLRSSGIRY